MTDCLTGNIVKLCKCGGERRPGQRNCRSCAAAASKAYRQRKAGRLSPSESSAFAEIARQIRNLNSTSGRP
jgi:hypothetical protein